MSFSRRFSACLLLAASLLAACSGKDTAGISAQIDKGDSVGALNTLTKQLAKSPHDGALNLLALKARLAHCAETNCAATRPAELALMATHLSYASPRLVLNKETKTELTLPGLFSSMAPRYAALPSQPTPVMALWNLAPTGAKPVVAEGFFSPILTHLRAGKTATALQQLQTLAQTPGLPPVYGSWATMVSGYVGNQPSLAQAHTINLRNLGNSPTIPASALKMLPHALWAQASYTSPSTATLDFTQSFVAGLPTLLLPQATSGSYPAMAAEVNTLREDHPWLTRALTSWPNGKGSTPVTTLALNPSSTAPTPTAAMGLALNLARMSLSLNPNQPQLWAQFLPQAESWVIATGDIGILAGLNPSALPSTTQTDYLTRMFKVIEAQATRNKPMLPLLEQIGSLKLDKQTVTRLEKLVQSGLENALSRRDLNAVLAYATFKPEIARTNRQTVVPLLVESIRNDMRTGNFNQVVSMGQFLNGRMGVDFNLDALILQEFSDTLKTKGIAGQLDAETPDILLQPTSSAALDLGPQWAFIKEYFAETPEVINGQLKNLIATAKGAYGTPVAFYRLNTQFSDASYPPADRAQYLAAAIGAALTSDAKLSGPQLADLTWKLSRLHTGLPIATLLEEALVRCESLEESRTLWQNAPTQVRALIGTIRPQFANLMAGIDAYTGGKKTAALRQFSRITTAQYGKQAEFYLLEYRRQLTELSGLYVAAAETSHPLAFVAIQAPALTGEGPIASLNVTFGNRLGSLSQSNPNTLSTDRGALKTQQLALTWDADHLTIPVPEDLRAQAAISPPFDEMFGAPSSLVWKAGGSTPPSLIVMAGGQKYTFTKVLADASMALNPTGRYVLTAPLRAVSGTEGLLPGGSILDLSATPDEATNTSAITGKLYHPAASKPLPLTGVFTPGTQSADFTYAYPLPSGGLVKAILRCQPLGGIIRCGASYQNQARQSYGLVMAGHQTRESIQHETKTRNALNMAATQKLRTLAENIVFATPEELLPVTSQPKALATSPQGATSATAAVSGTISSTTLTSPTLLPSGTTAGFTPAPAGALLPPPSFGAPATSISPSAGPTTPISPTAENDE